MKDNSRLFISKNAKSGSASQKYCQQIDAIADRNWEELLVHIAEKRFSPYGLRKGAATFANSGTTMSPSIPAIARRGEWSIGKVLDCYWHFDHVGDEYLGILASNKKLISLFWKIRSLNLPLKL